MVLKNRDFISGVNWLGLFQDTPDISIVKWAAMVNDHIRRHAAKGVKVLSIFLPFPFASPSKTLPYKVDRYIVKPDRTKDTWKTKFNPVFWKQMLRVFNDFCISYKIVPVYCLTGYTSRQVLHPVARVNRVHGKWIAPAGTLYNPGSIRFYYRVLEKLIQVCGKNIMVMPANEPHVGMWSRNYVSDLQNALAIARFHSSIIDKAISLGLADHNIMINVCEGFSRTTGEVVALCTGDALTKMITGKIDENGNKISNKRTKSKYVIWTDHNIGSLTDILGNICPPMSRYEKFSSLLNRTLPRVAPSPDGFKMDEGGLHSRALYNAFVEIGTYIKKGKLPKGMTAKVAGIFLDHPRGDEHHQENKLYEIVPGPYNKSSRFVMHLENILDERLDLLAAAYKEVHGHFPY